MNIELDEFDEMAFGLGPQQQQQTTAPARMTAEDPMHFLNSREPPQLRIPPKTAPPATSSTKIPLDGLFSDEDDDLFPAFHGSVSVAPKPKTAAADVPLTKSSGQDLHEEPNENSISGLGRSLEGQNNRETSSTRPATASIFDRLGSKSLVLAPDIKSPSGGISILGLGTESSSPLGRPSLLAGSTVSTTDSSVLGAKVPVKSSLFKNLATPPWDRQNTPVESSGVRHQNSQSDLMTPLSNVTIDKTESERQRRAMIFGGSSAVTPSSIPLPNTTVTSSAAQQEGSQLSTNSEVLISKVLRETKEAEEEDHRRVSSHHDFIRQQTQQAVQLQESQAKEFLKEYLAENKKQLDAHLLRLRSSFPLLQTVTSTSATGGGNLPETELGSEARMTLFGLEKKVEILERKLQDRDDQLTNYNALLIGLEDQHREELRDLRARHDEAQQRAAQTHHEYVLSLLANHESGRRQYEEALGNLRDAVSAKSSLEVVRGTVEQSARDFAIWRTELEQKHDSVLKEKDGQLRIKDNQIAELTSMLERQNEKSRAERETLQQRIQEDTARLLKRHSEVEEQSYTLQRERLELESERKNFHNLQAKEMQRLEKRMEETLRERQNLLETLAEDRHAVEEDKRKVADTIRAAEEKYALDYKKRHLSLDSTMEAVTAETRLLEEKNRNIDRQMASLKDERSRLEGDKQELTDRKNHLDKYKEELQKRDLELEQTTLRVAKIKRESDLALHEAKFMDEEHKNRVAKFNAFLEQLRDKELSLMRQAVAAPDGEFRQRAAIHLPDGSLTVVPHRVTPAATRMQLIPNPARDTHYWQGQRDYLQVLNGMPWTSKNSS